MHEAKEEIVRILVRVSKRDKLLTRLNWEIMNVCSEKTAQALYFLLLKIAYQLFNQIERLRVDHPLLNRPFIFKKKCL